MGRFRSLADDASLAVDHSLIFMKVNMRREHCSNQTTELNFVSTNWHLIVAKDASYHGSILTYLSCAASLSSTGASPQPHGQRVSFRRAAGVPENGLQEDQVQGL